MANSLSSARELHTVSMPQLYLLASIVVKREATCLQVLSCGRLTANAKGFNVPKAKDSYATEFARKGGKARARKLTPEQRSEIARKAVQARWAKEKKRLKSK
jgi:hypothetical protein